MKFYLIEITNYVDGSAESKGIYAYDTENEAVANFHSKMGGAMKNENYATELLTVLNSYGKVSRSEYFARPIPTPEPEPEVVEPTGEA